MEYLVEWTIHIHAENPLDAAKKCLEIHRDPNSIATVFDVYDPSGTVFIKQVDLLLEENNGN